MKNYTTFSHVDYDLITTGLFHTDAIAVNSTKLRIIHIYDMCSYEFGFFIIRTVSLPARQSTRISVHASVGSAILLSLASSRFGCDLKRISSSAHLLL